MIDKKAAPIDPSDVTPEDFIAHIFAEQTTREEVPLWSSPKAIPGYPLTEALFFKKARRATANAAYFGCSTMKPDDGRVFNRQSLFSGYFVLVLDDIGTGVGSKLIPEKLPPELRKNPSYIIETSPENFQYGYVFAKPLRDLFLAKLLQRTVIEASGTDSGGMMPNKLVRMPCGVNLKDKYIIDGAHFGCRLIVWRPGSVWTFDDLVRASDCGVSWKDLKRRGPSAQAARRRGTTTYRKTIPYHVSADGLVDSVYEWLNKIEAIIDENTEWVTIRCPWVEGHSEGDGTAGYSPIGMGSLPLSRAFHCFHDSCSDHGTRKFLAYVQDNGGPRAAQNAQIEEYIARYALEMENNTVIDMKSPGFAAFRQIGFKNQLGGQVWYPDDKGNFKAVNEYTAWATDPNRMRFSGRRHEVGGGRVLAAKGNGYPYLNTWSLPEWGAGDFEPEQVEPFIDFVHYLMPHGDDAEWFLDHLASKVQNPKYRGPGVIMATPTEGTGRGTLQNIITKLWAARNVVGITLSELVSGASASDNNSWIVRDWIVVAEAKEADMSAKKEHTAYESLKQFVETGASSIMWREKYEVSRQVECYGSVLIFSNHADAVPLDSGSTRFKRIANTRSKKSNAGFIELYDWIGSGFERHVWRWLLERDISNVSQYARQEPLTLAEELQSALDGRRAVDAAILLSLAYAEEHLDGMVLVGAFIKALEQKAGPLGLEYVTAWGRPVRRELRNKASELYMPNGKKFRPRVGGDGVNKKDKVTPRATAYKRGLLLAEACSTGELPEIPDPEQVTTDFCGYIADQLRSSE